jgi:ligand-binding sensor domain-containing protein
VLIQALARSLLGCLLAALWQVPAAAVENAALKSFLMRSWDASDGLPEGRIGALARTGDGYLWLVSGGRLVRFDGMRFSAFDATDLPSANHAAVTSLMVDGKGELWIGTATGALLRRRAGRFEMVDMPQSGMIGASITSMALDRDGTIWIATDGAGIVRFRAGLFERFDAGSGLPSNQVAKVAVDPQGAVWAVANEQLAKFGGERWEIWNRSNLPPLKAITPGRDSGLWLATVWPQALGGRGGRVLKAVENRLEAELSPYPWPQDTYTTCPACLLSDSAGRLWLGSYGSALRYFSAAAGWEDLATHGPLTRLDATCLAEDRDGAIYVGTAGGVLYQFRSRVVTTVDLPHDAERNFITASGAGSDGSIWIGTDGAGVFRYRSGQWTRFSADQGLQNSHIGCIFEDRTGRLWVGTWGGLHELRGDRFEPTPGPAALRQVVLALCDDPHGNLWVGTGGGVVRLGGGGIRVFGRDDGIDHFYIRGLAADVDGRVWVAVTDRGLYRLNGDRFEVFGDGQWQGGETIRAVLPDASGAVWIATFGNGLGRFHNGRFSQWTIREGLPSNELVAVTEDHRGNLWLASSNGVFACPKSQFTQTPKPFEKPLLFRHFTTADGLAGRRCSGVGQPVVAHSPDGRLWFPNDCALAVFDPLLAVAAMPGSSALIEEILADGARLDPGPDGVLRVGSNCRRYEFRYTAPDLHAPGQIRFRHRFSGLDDGWIDTGDRRSVVYGRLPPGVYEFAVMAGGPDGIKPPKRSGWRCCHRFGSVLGCGCPS